MQHEDTLATDITGSFLQLFGEHNLAATTELGMLDLDAAAERTAAIQRRDPESPARHRPSPRRTVSAPAVFESGSRPGYSNRFLTLQAVAETSATHQRRYLSEQVSNLFGDEYDEILEEDELNDLDEEDVDRYCDASI